MHCVKRVMVASVMCGAMVCLGGCSESGGAKGGKDRGAGVRTVTDDTGRTVELPADVDRIVAGSSFAAEYLIALGHPPVLRPDVAIEHVSAGADQLAVIDTLAIDHSVGPNMEQIVAADPDAVILSPSFARFAATIEQAADAPVLVYRIACLDAVPAKAEAFGRLIDKPRQGRALAASLRRQFDAIAAPADAHEPSVFAIFGTPASFFAFLPKSYLGSMVEHLGGRMITEDAPASGMSSQLAPFSLEALVEADPDVILLVHHGPAGEMADALESRENWANLRAVKSGRVHRVSEQLFMTNPGPSAVDALRQLRRLLYPGTENGS